MKNKIFVTLIIGLLLTGQAFSQSINTAKLDSLFDLLISKNKAMVSVVLARNGTTLYSRATGFASVEDNIAATVSTRYRIGSITKTYTSVMIFQLIEEGKLTLETKLKTFFPTVANAELITIGNLLNHRSGIHNFTNDPGYLQYMTQPKNQEEMVAIIAKTKPDFQPNEKMQYSNSNYLLLGYIIEKITKMPYQKNLESRILKKAGLKETYYGGKTDVAKNESYSYRFQDKWIRMPETDLSVPGGAGAIVSTPSDLTTFIAALFSGKLVSNGSLVQMKTITDGMGMGLFRVPFDKKTGYGHNGVIDGFLSNLFHFPEDGVSVAVCSNGTSYALNDMVIALLSSYYNVPFKLPVFTTIALKPEDLDKYTGTYSSTQLPIKITVAKNNATLTAQATGQGAFPLEATATDVFKFDQAGIVMEFAPAKNQFVLKQGGGNFVFTKE